MTPRTVDCQAILFTAGSWNYDNVDGVVFPWNHGQRVELHRWHLFRQSMSRESEFRSGLKVRLRKCLAWPGTNLPRQQIDLPTIAGCANAVDLNPIAAWLVT